MTVMHCLPFYIFTNGTRTFGEKCGSFAGNRCKCAGRLVKLSFGCSHDSDFTIAYASFFTFVRGAHETLVTLNRTGGSQLFFQLVRVMQQNMNLESRFERMTFCRCPSMVILLVTYQLQGLENMGAGA